MTQDINMPATVRALTTASKVGKSDRQRRENEKRRKRRQKKGPTEEQIQDLIEIEAQAMSKRSGGRRNDVAAGGLVNTPGREKPKVDIKI